MEARLADGFAVVADVTPAKRTALVLIDPPFERPDDYRRTVQAVDAVLRRNPKAVLLIWLPLKDLETFDAFLRDLEDVIDRRPFWSPNAGSRPLDDPMRMNGCALALVNPPAGLEESLQAVCAWTAAQGSGGGSRVWKPGQTS